MDMIDQIDLRRIVRDLAETGPPMAEMGCSLCEAPWGMGQSYMAAMHPDAHSVKCPWRRACEWVEANHDS